MLDIQSCSFIYNFYKYTKIYSYIWNVVNFHWALKNDEQRSYFYSVNFYKYPVLILCY